MRATLIFLIGLFLCIEFSCKKEDTTPPQDTSLLVKDPNVPDNFGEKINIGSNVYLTFFGNSWGNTGDAYFISANSGILKADFVQNKLTDIAPNSGGLITGISGDKSELIFEGTVNNQLGYYSYSFPDGPVAPLMSLNQNDASVFNFYDNHMLLSLGTIILVGRACYGPWDFWCGVGFVIQGATLYHIDKLTSAYTIIGKKMHPLLFSEDGSRALIVSDSTFYYYILDLTTLQKTDSFTINNRFGKFYWGNKLLYASVDLLSNDIIINDVLSGTVEDRFAPPSAFLIADDGQYIQWSSDGRKIFYTGAVRNDEFSGAIWRYDLDTRQEVQLTYNNPDSTGLNSRFEEMQVAPDDHKLVFRFINDLYLKTF